VWGVGTSVFTVFSSVCTVEETRDGWPLLTVPLRLMGLKEY
jgi:hypothetical protein